jgi:cation:H+ antiporter
MPSALLIAAGLAALLAGAELLVRGAAALAARLGVRPIVVGLTVVAIGTSLPELAIGIDAVHQGSPGLAVGNIVGTNLVNILFVLGLSALIRPIAFDRRTLRFDLPAMTAASLALLVLALDGRLDRVDGLILAAGGLAYMVGIVRAGRREAEEETAPAAPAPGGDDPPGRAAAASQLTLLVAGIGLVLLGAELLVDGATDVARSLDVSDATIGLTVVAIGTSAPELVTTLTATVRGNRDIAIGNVLGSSVYNIALILAVTVLSAPAAIAVPHAVIAADLLALAAVALITVPVLLTGHRLSRAEGGAFVAAYLAYLAWLILG